MDRPGDGLAGGDQHGRLPRQPGRRRIGAALVGSAYSQIGVAQDCTAMVEKALRSIGKSVGDIAPSDFFAFGSVVSTPAPGDLVVSAGHVAIYVGNNTVVNALNPSQGILEVNLANMSGMGALNPLAARF